MNQIYTISYNLYTPNESGEEEFVESTTTENPLIFCSGIGMLLPKFEENLSKFDDAFDFVLAKEDAYGVYNAELLKDAPRNLFETNGTLDEKIFFVGNIVPLMDAEGRRFNAKVAKIGDDQITFDLNHPLAGKDLHFKGSIIDVHEASEAEYKAFTQPHSCGGCGGSCSGGCGEGGDCGSDCGCGGCN
ncbi:MAG: peptidylprolyl isomerase [Paludibacteraceae bacterium]|nr:peptidylprolyl isomerase [Paludibacteraceae bacterium]MBQ7747711.1 peptidylprolyl isomerase [Paludibacteraceae bacterium]